MTWSDDINRFKLKVTSAPQAVLVAVATEAKNAIQFGSTVTGSPGQPVQTANLRDSWNLEFDTPTSAIISTNVAYARPIEDGIGRYGPLTLRSAVGGFHSVKLLIAGFPRLVEHETKRLFGGAP